MNAIKATALAAVAALALAAAPAPASAGPHWHGGHGGWGHHGGWHHGGGWGGPALALGLFGAAIAAGVAAESCIGYAPVYDDWGNYIGRRRVNRC